MNQAVRANLERVVSSEQRVAATRLAWLRLGLASAAFLTSFLVPTRPDLPIAATQAAAFAFCVVAGVVLFIAKRFPTMAKWTVLSVPLADVPMQTIANLLQQQVLPDRGMAVPLHVALVCGFVVMSALSLSPPIIIASAVAAMASIVIVTWGVYPEVMPLLLTAVVPVGSAVVLSIVVSRIRGLLHDARRKDFVGKYILARRLGQGGMAEVFLATYSPEGGFERTVAVKRILPGIATNADAVKLFRREAELGALLTHPNIVQVLDFGTDGSSYFLAMEYVDGTTLSRLMQEQKTIGAPLPLEACYALTWALLEALEYLHSRVAPSGAPLGLVHRDVNPPNVLVSRIGEVKLGDFGVAKVASNEQLTSAGVMRGKLAFSAPEQLRGEPYDNRADLFALGVTIFEFSTASRLFASESDAVTFKAVLDGPVPKLSERRADAGEALERVVSGLLERDLSKRTPTARVALEVLRSSVQENVVALGRRQLAELVSKIQSNMTPEELSGSGSTTSSDVTVTRTTAPPKLDS